MGSSSYTRPTPQQIEDWTGVNIVAIGATSQALKTTLRSLTAQAESHVALTATLARYRSTELESEEATALTRAVALVTAAYWLRSPQVRRTTGDHEPLLVEDSREIEDVIQSLMDEAGSLCMLVSGGGDTGKSQDRQYLANTRDAERSFTRTTVW